MKITLKASLTNVNTVVITKLDDTPLIKVEEKITSSADNKVKHKVKQIVSFTEDETRYETYVTWTNNQLDNIWLMLIVLGIRLGLVDVKIKYDMSYGFRQDKRVSLMFAMESLHLVKKHDERFWDKGTSKNGYIPNKSAMLDYLDSLDENAEYIAQSQTL